MARKSTHAESGSKAKAASSEAMLPERTEPDKTAVKEQRKSPQEGHAPRAGRTGGLGSRAERPSEGKPQPLTTHQVEPGRGCRSPSAADAVKRERNR